MITRIANNDRNTEVLNLNSSKDVKEKLDYYRTFFHKLEELTETEFQDLVLDIRTFFNITPAYTVNNPPERLVRISFNNRILSGPDKPLSYLTDISQLLAPPMHLCRYGRCNIPNQQVLYCSMNEAEAYWETRPKNGDVITISHFKLKPNVKFNMQVISMEKRQPEGIKNNMQEIYFLLDDFFMDAYSLLIDKNRPKDYLFSALLSSQMLFYPAIGDTTVFGIVYPSVQKKQRGTNLAIRNDVMFKYYDLVGVETRFILDEFENLDPESNNLTSEILIGSFGTKTFDFEKGKILYNENADMLFSLFRDLQKNGNSQRRNNIPNVPKNICFDCSSQKTKSITHTPKKYQRNDRVNVVYRDGIRKDNIKYKEIEPDLLSQKCNIVLY